jgi:catalase
MPIDGLATRPISLEEKMSLSLEPPAQAGRPRLGRSATLIRLALIGAALAAIVAMFAYLGGWLTPHELTPARFTDGFEQVNGVQPGFRRNHAKGLGVYGFFESNGEGARLSKASVFRSGRVPVIGRFSLGGGLPYQADKPDTVRGLGIQFALPDGELWRTAMINLPVFPFSTPEGFYEQMLASKPDPATGKPDPEKLQAFLARHPETVRASAILKDRPVSSGFENTTFYGLNAFRFTSASGDSTPVRWWLRPEQPFEAAGTAPAEKDKNYLFDALIARIGREPLRWHLLVTVGQPGDPTNDASAAWPEGRESVDVGTLTLDRAESDETSAATDLNFDPLVLPAGIAPSDDPLLSARSAVYSQSFTRRAGEAKQTPAVTPADVHKGE